MKFYDGGEKFGFVSDKKEHSATSSHEFHVPMNHAF